MLLPPRRQGLALQNRQEASKKTTFTHTLPPCNHRHRCLRKTLWFSKGGGWERLSAKVED